MKFLRSIYPNAVLNAKIIDEITITKMNCICSPEDKETYYLEAHTEGNGKFILEKKYKTREDAQLGLVAILLYLTDEEEWQPNV